MDINSRLVSWICWE